jgi:hypothetical protein
MAEIPPPSNSAPSERWKMLIRGVFAIARASAEVIIAMNSEVTVVGMSYARAMGSEKASMPMKCIDQIPLPMASAPPSSHSRDSAPRVRTTRTESPRAVCETKMATATDKATSQGL